MKYIELLIIVISKRLRSGGIKNNTFSSGCQRFETKISLISPTVHFLLDIL